jgi:hypothetical protein
MGRSQRAESGSCRHRVRRSHDRAERDRLCPWHRRYERVSDEGDSGCRESDREYNQAGHWRPIIPEISERRIVSRIEEYGCDEERQRKLSGYAERGRAWERRQQRTAEGEEYRKALRDGAPQRPGSRPRRTDQELVRVLSYDRC